MQCTYCCFAGVNKNGLLDLLLIYYNCVGTPSSITPIGCVFTLCNPFMHYVQLFHPNWCTIVSPKLVASVRAVRRQNLADAGGMGHLVVSCLDIFA